MRAFQDALGRTVEFASPPGRIVSLVPSLTEALFAFGVGDRVVGVTRFCVEPADRVAAVPRIGGTKDVNTDAVLALGPDLVIANVEENTREDVERLGAAGVTVMATYPRTVVDAIDELLLLAEITGAGEVAAAILEDATEAAASGPRPVDAVPVFAPIWRRPLMTIGADTYVHDMIRVCGGRNVFEDSPERYPEVTLDEVRDRGPQVVLLPDEPYPFDAKHQGEVIDALGPVRTYLVDGKDLCWYGPRIGPAIHSLRKLLAGAAPAAEL